MTLQPSIPFMIFTQTWIQLQLARERPKLQRDEVPDDSNSDSETGSKRRMKAKPRKAKRSVFTKVLDHLPEDRPLSAEEEWEQKLLFRQSIMQFSTVERREASFPEVGILANTSQTFSSWTC
jgi:hypothetical protein